MGFGLYHLPPINLRNVAGPDDAVHQIVLAGCHFGVGELAGGLFEHHDVEIVRRSGMVAGGSSCEIIRDDGGAAGGDYSQVSAVGGIGCRLVDDAVAAGEETYGIGLVHVVGHIVSGQLTAQAGRCLFLHAVCHIVLIILVEGVAACLVSEEHGRLIVYSAEHQLVAQRPEQGVHSVV